MSTPPLPRTLTRLPRRLPLPPPPHRRLSCSRLLAHQQQPQYQDLPTQDGPPTSTTHFGFQTVPASSKNSRVATVFSSVAASYDTMNDLMSLGIHRLWKDRFVRHIDPGIRNCGKIEAAEDHQEGNNNSNSSDNNNQEGQTILDVAGGTGDIAFRMLKHCTAIKNDHVSKIIVADINPDMLAEGQRRARQAGHHHHHNSARLSWLEADAENLTAIADDSVDLYTVAFGIRNFTRKAQALREARRVLRPGGVFACLEFSRVRGRVWGGVYRRWRFGAIPLIGQVVAGDRGSYQYLVESIERFPGQEEWEGMIEEAGFVVPRGEGGRGWEDLMGGIACVHKGVKPLR